ncbi:MAG: multidrug transporter [Proteobacteria bacterium]|nr:MAG: multidrug transporter [Pseudomonadota bacterium]
MNIPRLAIRNYQFTIIIILMLVFFGINSFFTMPRAEDPQFDFPAAVTTIVYPGTSAQDLEKLVIDPIESAINEIEDIKVMRTDIEDGMGVIRTEFLYGSDPDEKYDEVVSSINAISDSLPDDLQHLKTYKTSPADTNIMQIALVSGLGTYNSLKYQAEILEQRIERVAGVKRVDIDALPDQEVHIQIDVARMAELNLSLEHIAYKIQSAASNIPGGHVNSRGRRFTVQTSGDFGSLDEIRNLVIKSHQNSTLHLRDIASVELTDALPRHHATYHGKKAVFLSVVQRKHTDIFSITDKVKEIINAASSEISPDIELKLIFDQSESVERRVNGFFANLSQGLICVGLLALVILGFRAATVVILAIPLSILIGIGWLDIAGFGLQQMSVTGLIVALGLLVDNAIVVTENVGRYLRMGYSKYHSAVLGASEVSWAVISGTLTTILAFFPILILPNDSGTFMRSMPVTVVFTLCASLVIAIALTPLMASRFLKPGTTRPAKGKTKAVQGGNPMVKLFDRFTEGPYQAVLKFSLNYPKLVMTLAVALFVSSAFLIKAVGVSLFPKAEKPMVMVNIETAEGTAFQTTKSYAERIARQVMSFHGVTDVVTNVGKGNPRIYYNIPSRKEAPNFAQLLVHIATQTDEETRQFVTELRKEFRMTPGARITVHEFAQGPPTVAPIAIRITGEELDQLGKVSADIEQIIKKTPGTVSVDNPAGRHKVDMAVTINREKAAMLGIDLQKLDQNIRTSLVGLPVAKYTDSLGDEHDIMLTRKGSASPDWRAFQTLRIQNDQGKMIPLNHLVDLQLKSEIPRFQHHDTERMVRVTADVLPGYQTELVTNAVVERLEEYPWPNGVRFLVGGEQEQRKETFQGMMQALIIALVGIFAVLVMQFRSFAQPLIIFTAIPFAMTGAILGLWINGYTFSFTAFIGLISLVGIVVNNSIILVDFANQVRIRATNEGRVIKVKEAIITASKTRLLPIVLTTLTTIGGLLPLTLSGSSMWSPLGWVIIGGLTVSTVLTLIIVPILYQWLTKDGIATVEEETIRSGRSNESEKTDFSVL